jgi:hypothetical protein
MTSSPSKCGERTPVMKYILIGFLSLTLLLAWSDLSLSQSVPSNKPQPRKFKHNSKVEKKYDKDQTTVYLRPMTMRNVRGSIEAQIINEGKKTETIPSEVLWMTAYFVSPGKVLVKPRFVVIGFRSWTLDKTKYASDHTLIIDFDGSSINLGPMEVVERRIDPNMELHSNQYFLESLELPLPYETFLRITKADKVKMTLGGTEFQLGNEHLEAFRDLISGVE